MKWKPNNRKIYVICCICMHLPPVQFDWMQFFNFFTFGLVFLRIGFVHTESNFTIGETLQKQIRIDFISAPTENGTRIDFVLNCAYINVSTLVAVRLMAFGSIEDGLLWNACCDHVRIHIRWSRHNWFDFGSGLGYVVHGCGIDNGCFAGRRWFWRWLKCVPHATASGK